MDWNNLFFSENEKPLDRMVGGISNTAIFRTIGVVGDSLSSGEFESMDADGNSQKHDFYEYSWGGYLARKYGITVRNFSQGGMYAEKYIKSFAEANRFWSPEMACQAYIIALGINDIINLKQEIGTADDIDKSDWHNNKDTFAGHFSIIISRLKEIQPRAKFFLVTMPREGNKGDEVRKAHAKLMHELSELFDNCYIIDLHKYGPVYDADFKKRFYLYQHMNPSGYILTANLIDSYIDYIIRKYPDDFRRVPFIGTDLK